MAALQVELPTGSGDGDGDGETVTPASTKLARGLRAELDAVLARPPRSPASAAGFLSAALAPAAAPTGAWSAGAVAAAATNARAVKNAETAMYDYCGANVQEILAEKVGDDGKQVLLVSWLGRCVPDKWVPRTFLEDDFVSRGLLAAYDEDRSFEAEAKQDAAVPATSRDDEQDDTFSIDDDDQLDDLSATSSSTGAAVDRVMTAFESGDVHFSDGTHDQDVHSVSSGEHNLTLEVREPPVGSTPDSSVVKSVQADDADMEELDSAPGRQRARASRQRHGGIVTKENSRRRTNRSKWHEKAAVRQRTEVTVDELPLDCRPYWRSFYAGFVKGGLPFERVARQLAGPRGRCRGVDGSSLVTAGGVARMLCRFGMIGSHSTDLSTDSKVVRPPTPWRALKAAQRAHAIAEGTELLYEVAELGRCEESLNGKEEERVVTLSSLSLAILYYRTINDRTHLEPRRLFTMVEFLLFAHPGQSVSQTPLLMATNAFQLLVSRYGGQISRIPSRMYEHVETRERYNGSYSFLQWLNSPLPLLPPQWTVL